MSQGNWPRCFLNWAFVTIASVFFAIIFNSIAGFAFSRLNFPGRNVLFMLMLRGLMMPPQVTLLPTFMIMVVGKSDRLYDLPEDPFECRDIASEQPEKAKRLKKLFSEREPWANKSVIKAVKVAAKNQ